MIGDAETESDYQRGFRAAFVPSSECPYPEPSAERDEWYDGFGDGTDALIWWNYGPEGEDE